MRVHELAGFDDLGRTEYWVMDEEGGVDPVIKATCPPFILSPGYRVQVPGPYGQPRERVPKRPGFISGFGNLGYFEIVDPGGGTVAAFRCMPYYVGGEFAVKEVRGGMEVLRQGGAAEFPEGTMRPRRGMLYSVRR